MAGTTDDSISTSTLDTSKAERSVWLLKCPPIVARAWKEVGDSAQSLAKITVSIDPLKADDQAVEVKIFSCLQVVDPTAPSTINKKVEPHKAPSNVNQSQSSHGTKSEFMMELMAYESVTAPKSYSLNMFTDIVPMYIFSETNQGNVAIAGKVEHKFDMKPHTQNIEDYRRLCRERTNKSNTKTRQIQMIDNEHGGFNPMQGMMDFSTINLKDRKGAATQIKPQEMKRTRMERNDLENILFKLFERQSNWTLKQLVTQTDQPLQFIKEVLNDLGVYNKRGTNQGTYELKLEYKKTVEDMEAD